MVSVHVVVPVERKEVVTGSDGIKLLPDAEVGTKSALRISLTIGYGKTERNRDVVDDVLERVAVFSGAVEGGAMTEQGVIGRLAEGNIDVLDLERVEESTDILGCLARNGGR